MHSKLKILAVGFSVFLSACATDEFGTEYFVSEVDVEILEQAKLYLSDETKWTRGEETQCDLEAEALTLFCALQKASFDVLNEFQLRRPAMEEVRYAIDEETGTDLERRILDFNNLETTNFEDILNVIDKALEGIRARLAYEGG